MSIPELNQSLGAMSFPINAENFTDSLAPLDPCRDRLLELFRTAINAEFGAVWAKVIGSLPADSKFQSAEFPVSDVLPMRPSAQLMQQRKPAFPLLCLHREGTFEVEPFTLESDRLKQQWQLHYILGPGDVEVERKLLDITQAIGRLIYLVIRARGHAAYESGALQFFPESGGLESVRLVKQDGPGQAAFTEDNSVTYWACTWTLESTEIPGDNVGAFGNFDALDAHIAGGDSGNKFPELIVGSSDVPVQRG